MGANLDPFVPVPQNATSGNLVVTVAGVDSNATPFSILGPPVAPAISGNVSPNSGTMGATVTITGTGFGASASGNSVTFNGIAAIPASWSATSIVAAVPQNATSGNVIVTVAGVGSNGMPFTVVSPPASPNITGLSPNAGEAGTSVTITGTGFGASASGNSVTFNGVAAIPASWSATSIVAAVPATATSGNVTVMVGGVGSNGMPFTVLAGGGGSAPVVTSLLPNSGQPGALLLISGSNFGLGGIGNTVTLNGVTCIPTSWSTSTIIVTVPQNVSSGNIAVTVGGIGSNGVPFTVTGPPAITGVSPSAGPVGALVTIAGINFGSMAGNSITFNGLPATPVTWTGTSIVVTVPQNATSGNVVVSVTGIDSSPVPFSVRLRHPSEGFPRRPPRRERR